MRQLLLQILLFLPGSVADGQTLVSRWYGKNGERLIITKDSSMAEFKAGGLPSKNYDLKISGDSTFSLGDITWKTISLKSSDEYDKQKTEKLVEWYPFKVLKLSVDTLIVEYASAKHIKPTYFERLTFFSYQKLQEIKNPVFINLQYDRSGFHVSIDSTGYAKYWFDAPNGLGLPPGKLIEGKLTTTQMVQLRYWFSRDELQDLPEYIGSTADGVWKQLTIKAFPKNIIAYGTGRFSDDIEFGLINFLSNIDKEIKQ